MSNHDVDDLLPDAPPIFSTKSLAAIFPDEFTERALESYRFRGLGPPYIKLGARVFYLRIDVEAWLLRQRKVPSSEVHDSASAT